MGWECGIQKEFETRLGSPIWLGSVSPWPTELEFELQWRISKGSESG